MFLTQESGLIMGPITKILGLVINGLYNLFSGMGIVSIGLTIIVFTILIRLILFPSMFKQNKSSKINNYIQPEINKIQKKYRNKKDQESMLKQQQEVREVQEKYGASMTGGCLMSLVQLPIFFAIYNVVQNIPAYVTKIKQLYSPIADAIKNDQKAFDALVSFKEESNIAALKMIEIDNGNTNTIIDALAQFSTKSWDSFIEQLGGNSAAVVDVINSNIDQINEVYSFIGGINLMTAPGFKLTLALLIPVLSMVFQFLSMNATPIQLTGDPTQDATMKSMKTMMNVMPIMSFFITVNVPAGVGLYWATGSLVSFITSKAIKLYFDKADMEKIVEKSKENAAKKIAKRKAKGKKTFMEKMMEASNGQQPQQQTTSRNLASNGSLKNYSSATMKTQSSGVKYREGSLAAKANALQRFNDNNGGKN